MLTSANTGKQILDQIEDAEKRVASIVLGAEGPVIFYSVGKPSDALIFLPVNGREIETGGRMCPTI
jgi:hypothetical protein